MNDSPKNPLYPVGRQAKSKTAHKKDGIVIFQQHNKVVIEVNVTTGGEGNWNGLMPGDLLAVVDEVLSYYDQ